MSFRSAWKLPVALVLVAGIILLIGTDMNVSVDCRGANDSGLFYGTGAAVLAAAAVRVLIGSIKLWWLYACATGVFVLLADFVLDFLKIAGTCAN